MSLIISKIILYQKKLILSSSERMDFEKILVQNTATFPEILSQTPTKCTKIILFKSGADTISCITIQNNNNKPRVYIEK